MVKWLRRLRLSECGQALVEYALILSVVAVALLAVLFSLRNSTGNVYDGASNTLDQVVACSQASGSASCGGSAAGGAPSGGSNHGSSGNGHGGGNGQGNNGNGNGNGGGNGSNGKGGGNGNQP